MSSSHAFQLEEQLTAKRVDVLTSFQSLVDTLWKLPHTDSKLKLLWTQVQYCYFHWESPAYTSISHLLLLHAAPNKMVIRFFFF